MFLSIKMASLCHGCLFPNYNSIIITFQPKTAPFPYYTTLFDAESISITSNSYCSFYKSGVYYLNNIIITIYCLLKTSYATFNSYSIILPSDWTK